MKSVGEVMAIGRTFQESVHKALRGLVTAGFGTRYNDKSEIIREIGLPGPERILYVADAFRIGMTLEEIFEISKIDPWFLAQLRDLIEEEGKIAAASLPRLGLRHFAPFETQRLCRPTHGHFVERV